MSGLLWRILIAVVLAVLIFALLPPVFRIFGFNASSDVLLVFRICIGGILLLYVLRGPDRPFMIGS